MQTLERAYTIPPFGELRVMTSFGAAHATRVVLQETQGEEQGTGTVQRADICGTELLPSVALHLPAARSFSVFSPTGCTVALTAPPAVLQRCYVTMASELWRRSVLELHTHLEVLRGEARAEATLGPRVLFVGDRHRVGMSTYCELLAQYAVRLGYHPLLLDAVGEGPRFGYPSCVSLYHLQYAMDVEEEMCFVPGLHVCLTQSQRESNAPLYLHAVRQLCRVATDKLARNERCRVGGFFLDYGVVDLQRVAEAEHVCRLPGRNSGIDGKLRPDVGASASDAGANPLDTLLDVIVEAEIDHVVVVQSAWLRFKLAQRAHERFAGPHEVPLTSAPAEMRYGDKLSCRLLLVEGVGQSTTQIAGVVTALRRQRWLHYFFGTPTSPLKPTLARLDVGAVRLAVLGGSKQSSMATLMPMDDDDDDERDRATTGRDTSAATTARVGDAAAVTFVTTEDVELRGRVLGISTATEYTLLPNRELQRVPFNEFERHVKQGFVSGFALVESVTADKLVLLVSGAAVRKELGLCLLLTNEFLLTQNGDGQAP